LTKEKNKVNCIYIEKHKKKSFLLYWSITLFFCLASTLNIVNFAANTQNWWVIWLYVVSLVLFIYFDFTMHCSHCDFYRAGDKTFQCPLNLKLPKIFPEKEGPLKTHEKLIILTLYIYMMVLPFVITVLNVYVSYVYNLESLSLSIGLGILFLVSIIIFWWVMLSNFCSNCQLISCPLNLSQKPNK
jgi:hypothetical protein